MAKRHPPRKRTRSAKKSATRTRTPAHATRTAAKPAAQPAVSHDEAIEDDQVIEASRESFPASDPPAWMYQHV